MPGLGHLARGIPEENARRRASDAIVYARPGLVPTTREMRYGFEAIDITKEKSEFMAGRIVVTTSFFDIGKKFS